MECSHYSVFINLSKNLITIIQIIAPVVLIVSLIIIFIKMMRAPDEKKNYNRLKNAFLATIVIFFMVNIVDALLIALGNSNEFTTCWNNSKKTSFDSTYIPSSDKKKKTGIIDDSSKYEKGVSQGHLSTSKTTKVVFIGNSKTYVSNIPGLFGNIANSAGYNVIVTSITEGGKTLSWHANNNATKLQQPYDIAILQEQTDTMETNLALYSSGAKQVASFLRKGNSKIGIYIRQCWGLKSRINTPYHQIVQDNAKSVSSLISGDIINDGLAWDQFGNPSILYSDDTHQSLEGAYLSAICIFKTISNSDPTNVNYYGGLDEKIARQFQKIAKDVC